MRSRKLKTILLSTAALLAVAAAAISTGPVIAGKAAAPVAGSADTLTTKYPIKHLVVVFKENRSFDHYFGTYPNALNVDGEPAFKAAKGTQTDINNLLSSPSLLDNNPNLNPANGANASNPFRLDRTQANTADQSHSYGPEQKAYDGGKNDLFPLDTGSGTSGGAGAFGTKAQVMGYFDGNTVTAFWNYAQNYAMSDNSWGDQFGPSTPGAINMFAGNTNGFVQTVGSGSLLADGSGGFTLDRRYRSERRRLLEHDQPGHVERQEHRRPAEWREHSVGQFLRWLQPANHQRQRQHRLQAHHRCPGHWHPDGLRAAPHLVPVLRLDGQPDPRPSDLDQGHRLHHGPGHQEG